MEFYHGALQDLALLLVKGPVLSTSWKMFSMYLMLHEMERQEKLLLHNKKQKIKHKALFLS